MTKILDFPTKNIPDPQLKAMVEFANSIDDILKDALSLGELTNQEICMVLAHRIGHLIELDPATANKEEFLKFCTTVAKKKIDSMLAEK